MNEYNNLKNIFALCNGKWDPTRNKFVSSSNTEVFKCCMNRCSYPINYCNAYCEDRYGPKGIYADPEWKFRCNTTCGEHKNLCEEGCKIGEHWLDSNPFIGCAKDRKCWLGIGSRPECVVKHKDELIDCCHRNCRPTSTMNCNQLCDYMYKLTSQPRFDMQAPTFTPQQSIINNLTHKKSFNIAMGIVFGILILLIIFVLLRIKK